VKRLVAASAVMGLSNALAAPMIVEGNIVAIIGAVVATVTLTLTVVAWIDRRIDHKIRNHANVEQYQFRTLLREISNLRELSGHPPLAMAELLKVSSNEKE
jgi:nitrogen fixation/metabolism regulation signal transduction histidine kinase